MHEPEFVCQRMTVRSIGQTVEGVGDEVVEGGYCCVELVDPVAKGDELGVEVGVGRVESREVVFDSLEEVDSTISEGD